MKKNDNKFLDTIIYMNIALLVVFTIIVLVIFTNNGGIEPSTLIHSFFLAFGFENGLCAWIYTTKVKCGVRSEEEIVYEENESDEETLG